MVARSTSRNRVNWVGSGMSTDPIADMLSRIRNTLAVKKEMVVAPSSKSKEAIAKIMVQEGYLLRYEVTKDKPQPMLRMWLKYGEDKEPVLTGLRRISRPGRRFYVPASNIPRVLAGMGVAVLSTSRGVMTDRQARRLRVGGEVVCYLW